MLVARRWGAVGRWCPLGVVVAAVCSGARFAQADAPAVAEGHATLARSLFIQGKHLMNDRKYEHACAAFARSYALEPKVSTLANLADCAESQGALATAKTRFEELAAKLAKAKEASAVSLRALARQRAAALRQRESSLQILVAEGQPEGFEVLVNGAVVKPSDLERWIGVDGGWWNVMARAPGHRAWAIAFAVRAEGDKREVRVPLLEAGAGVMCAGELPLGLDRKAFDRTMTTVLPQLEVCGAGFPGAMARIMVSVSPLGLVERVAIEGAEDPWLRGCLTERIKATVFAMTLQGGEHSVTQHY